MGKFNSMTIISTTVGKNPLEKNGVGVIVNKRAVLECNLKNDRMISIPFQSEHISLLIILCHDSECFSILQIVWKAPKGLIFHQKDCEETRT